MARTKSKDALAWSIIYGGTALAQTVALSAAVAAGFVHPKAGQSLMRSLGPNLTDRKKQAWQYYTKTGDIGSAIGELFD